MGVGVKLELMFAPEIQRQLGAQLPSTLAVPFAPVYPQVGDLISLPGLASYRFEVEGREFAYRDAHSLRLRLRLRLWLWLWLWLWLDHMMD